MRLFFIIACFWGSVNLSYCQTTLCDSLEKFAKGVESLDLESLNYHLNVFVAGVSNIGKDQRKRYHYLSSALPSDYEYFKFHEWLSNLENPNFESCLKHADGKIVALALLGVYYTYGVEKVFEFSKFLNDERPSFKWMSNKSNGYPLSTIEERIELRKKHLENASVITLNQIAQTILNACFRSSGYGRIDQDLDKYLTDHQNLSYGYGHTKTLYYRAKSASFHHLNPEVDYESEFKVPHIKKLPAPEKFMYALMLEGEDYVYNKSSLFKKEDIMWALNGLGRAELLNILKRKPSSKDPDLFRVEDEDFHNYDYAVMSKVVLNHADQFLDKKDIPFLLERAAIEREELYQHSLNMQFSDWYIACANLDPENAEKYLNTGLENLNKKYQDFERAKVYQSYIDLMPEKKKRTLDWFFGTYVVDKKIDERPDQMISNLMEVNSIKSIVLDARFMDKCRIQHVEGLAQRLNYLSGQESISNNLIRNLSHPFGLSSIETRFSQAKEKYPEQTAEVEQNAKVLKQALIDYFN